MCASQSEKHHMRQSSSNTCPQIICETINLNVLLENKCTATLPVKVQILSKYLLLLHY